MTPQWLADIKAAVASLEEETTKFYVKGNKSAAGRARKNLQEIKTLCGDARKAIQADRTSATAEK